VATANDVAKWMVKQMEESPYLYQETVVYDIKEKFGEQFTYDNVNGNLAISRDVLTAFRKLTKETAIWVRSERCWRKREAHDGPGRRQE